MTVLSWDRYLAVCSPVKSIRMRRTMIACFVLLLCSALAIILLLPVVINATVVHVDVHTGSLIMPLHQNDTFYNDHYQHYHHHVTQTKCVFEESNPTFILHKSAANAHRHSFVTKQRSVNIRIRQVTKRIIAMILFYFFCWTPHWTLNLLAHFELIVVSWSTLTLSSIFFAAHLLVCFNSAVNPILYALINRELRQQHTRALIKRCRSLSNATSTAFDALIKHSHHLVEYATPLHCNYDPTGYHENRQNAKHKDENNSPSPTTIAIVRSCSFSNATITTGNDNELKRELLSSDQIQHKVSNDTTDDDDGSLFSNSSSGKTIITTGFVNQSEFSNTYYAKTTEVNVDHVDSFL
uniref:G-protein coupled receptors family 1 profile domain-containing protein n=1 Tax=Setaria digitata TaxID=48799 RepID=A0A915Q2E7_9BILA